MQNFALVLFVSNKLTNDVIKFTETVDLVCKVGQGKELIDNSFENLFSLLIIQV